MCILEAKSDSIILRWHLDGVSHSAQKLFSDWRDANTVSRTMFELPGDKKFFGMV